MSTSVNDELMYNGSCNVVTPTRDASGNVVGLGVGDKRVGSVCLLHYENEGGFIALPSSAEQIVGDVVLIPANTLKPGDRLRFVAISGDAGTSDAQSRTCRIRIHTTASVLSGQSLAAAAIASAINAKCSVDKTTVIISNTKAMHVPGPASGVASASVFTEAVIDCTVDQYIGITIQNANTLVNHLVYQASLVLEPVQ